MFEFPEWLQTYQIEDEVFADAYEATSPSRRAWLKKTIAQVYSVNSPETPQKTWNVNTWNGGFETEVATAPLEWTVLLLDARSVSPVRILAALVPALTAGVKQVLVAFCGEGEISKPVLAGFELAGQEDVVQLPMDKIEEFLGFLLNGGAYGAVLDLRGDPDFLLNGPCVRYWRVPEISSISVCKNEDFPDMDVLAFVHPDVEFVEVDEDSLDEGEADAAVVPAELVGEALMTFNIVLAHGQEGCWLWNGFNSSFFKRECVALAVAE
ncbi:histidinol dehydrogenase [Maridesulfovibrio sp.]|uniref:histidinol dehydrogenase n=1 Tax=Maridesulfovibrio sp. TaxID=2795000 RepID=UPI0039F11D80